MPEKKSSVDQEISMKNTKNELLAAYNDLRQKIEEKQKLELNPGKKAVEKKKEEVLTLVSDISADGVLTGIDKLKGEIGKVLAELAGRLEAETKRLDTIRQAILLKDEELKEIYEIERAAATLAALIEAHQLEEQNFAVEMKARKAALEDEINATRKIWDTEKEQYKVATKEQQATEEKNRKREKEEYLYAFKREQQLAKNVFADEKTKLDAEVEATKKEIGTMKVQAELELAEREKQISAKETEFQHLQEQVESFSGIMEKQISEQVEAVRERLQLEAGYQKDLLEKQFEGERNVLTARIESLLQTVKEQAEQVAKLSKQQEGAYQKVQDVALKAIDGASKLHSFEGLQRVLVEQGKKPATES